MLTRRNFLAGFSVASLAGCFAPGGLLSGRPRLKFGVLSDIHITDWDSTAVFRKALRHFRDQEVDAVMIAGDMADHGILPQLENVAKAWYEVFPGDALPDGRHVEKLFVYGNHDPDGLGYRDAAMDKAFQAMHMTYEEAEKVQLRVLGMGRCWEKCFHEKYEPIYHKKVNGYDFVGAHWMTYKGADGLGEWFDSHISEIDTTKPFFFFQHATPKGTIYGADSWGDDDGRSTRILTDYPNAVAFSGHSHRTLTDLRSYWQGEFTSVGTSTLSYVSLPGGRDNRYNYRDRLDGRQGQIVNVYDDRLVFVRRDFIMDEDLDEAIVIELPVRPKTFSVQAVLEKNIPRYAKGAKIDVTFGVKALKLKIPTAFANPTARPFDYRVNVEVKLKDGSKKEVFSRLWYQTDAIRSRSRAARTLFHEISVARSKFPAEAEFVRVHAAANNCYGSADGWLSTKWIPYR